MTFNAAQTAQLLKPIAPARVLKDADGHSHVSQQDITAHLIRVFGFGGFDTEILDVQCVFEEPTKSISKGKDKPDPNRFDICYRALLRLSVKDAGGKVVAQYEDGSTATAQNQRRGAGHDLAYKSALSLAKKRAAINLGDQFGLSLYNKGQMSALVKGTLAKPAPDGIGTREPAGDVQDGVEQQVSLGNDEIDTSDEIPFDSTPLEQAIAAAENIAALTAVGKRINESHATAGALLLLREQYRDRLGELQPARTP